MNDIIITIQPLWSRHHNTMPKCTPYASATLEMHAGCMQAACRLHAACMQPATSCMQDAATCNLLHTIVCRLHEACMKPACRLQPPACNLLQPATSCIRWYSQRSRQSAQFFVDPDVQGVDPDVQGVDACTPACHQCEFDRARIATLNFLSQSRQANGFSPVWILWYSIM